MSCCQTCYSGTLIPKVLFSKYSDSPFIGKVGKQRHTLYKFNFDEKQIYCRIHDSSTETTNIYWKLIDI